MRDSKLRSLASPYAKTTSAGTAFALTVPAGANYALVKAETKGFRWRCASPAANPTSTDGMLIDTGDEFWFTGELSLLRFIEDGATSTGTLHVHFFG